MQPFKAKFTFRLEERELYESEKNEFEGTVVQITESYYGNGRTGTDIWYLDEDGVLKTFSWGRYKITKIPE